jgi:hypothetical protein
VSCCCNPLGGDTPGGGSPLSNVFFVDQAAAGGGDGSIARPYNTLLAAVTAHPTGGTFALTPYDYSDETIPDLAEGNWTFWGFPLAGMPGGFDQFVVPPPLPTQLPSITIGAGGSASTVALRSVLMPALTVRQSCALLIQDCTFDGVFIETAADASVSLRADRSFFNSSGVGGSALGAAQFDDCGFWGSQTILTAGTLVQLTRCYGQTSVNFTSVSAGVVAVDTWSDVRVNIPAITNGVKSVQAAAAVVTTFFNWSIGGGASPGTFLNAWGGNALSSGEEDNSVILVPGNGALSELRLSTPDGSDVLLTDQTAVIRVDGINTTLQATVTVGSSTGQSGAVVELVSAFQRVSLVAATDAGPLVASVKLTLTP